jgi:hypothetical protein
MGTCGSGLVRTSGATSVGWQQSLSAR